MSGGDILISFSSVLLVGIILLRKTFLIIWLLPGKVWQERLYLCTCMPTCFCCVRLPSALWTVDLQAPLSMGILQARILEWVVMPSSSGSSWPREGTQVSRIAGKFFTVWATREAHYIGMFNQIISNWLIKSIGDGFKLQPLCFPWRLDEVGGG